MFVNGLVSAQILAQKKKERPKIINIANKNKNMMINSVYGVLLTLSIIFLSQLPSSNSVKPIVLWHGMGDSCCFPFSMGKIEAMIRNHIKQIKNETVFIHSIKIGDSILDDVINSYMHDANEYVNAACKQIASIPELKNGFNGIGFSQGAQFMRAYVQRCNQPAVKNLISIGGQHQGVYGLPRCPGVNSTLCEYARQLLDLGAYLSFVQHNLIQAQYWHDPWNNDLYLKNSNFLADINNERPIKNEQYKKNLLSLDTFVMVKFLEDSFVQPIESEWFGFYELGQDTKVLALNETQLYQEDWLGLKMMDKAGKLKFQSVDADHLRFDEQWFVQNIIPFLIN